MLGSEAVELKRTKSRPVPREGSETSGEDSLVSHNATTPHKCYLIKGRNKPWE